MLANVRFQIGKGHAIPGDRTMLDALDPFVRSFNSSGANASRDVLLSAVEAAKRGAEAPPQ